MNAVEDQMFSSRTDHELLSWYNGAVARARAMGMEVKVVHTFPERQLLVDTCEALHNDMVLHSAAAEAQEAEKGTATNGEASAEPSPPSEKEKSRRKSTAPKTSKTAEASAPAETPPAPKRVTKKETTKMAAQATATATAVPAKGRKAAAAVPAPAPKGRKAAAAPAPAPEPKEPRRTDFDDNAKITWLVPKGQPIPGAREGSAKFDRWALIAAHNGKKVSVFKANGGNLTSLANAIEKECASVG